MDELSLIIGSFSDTERKEFRQFIHRSRFRENRKDLLLFNQIAKQSGIQKAGGLIERKSEKKAQNAYHSIRKRLVRHLHDFIYSKSTVRDESVENLVSKNLILVKSLFDHQLNALAWKYLLRSENMAVKADLNQQLVLIYDLEIVHFNPEFLDTSLDKLIARRLKASGFAQEEERLRIVGSLVKRELEKVKIQGHDLDLQKVIDRLLVRFDLDDTIFNRPRLLYDFVVLTRNVVLAEKTFYSFEAFVITSFKRLRKSHFFENNSAEFFTMLYFVCHTLYRNRKFADALEYLEMMNEALQTTTKSLNTLFKPRYLMLQAACKNFSGHLQESISILESLLQSDLKTNPEILNSKLNLAIYYFELKDYKTANKILLNLGHTDKWCEKIMGVEWRLKKNLIEVFFQYELGRSDIAYDRITALERSHRDLLKIRKYERVGVFLKLVKGLIDKPEQVHSLAFIEKVESSFVWIDIAQEDIQAISYYAWLKSKMLKRDFYLVLLDLINPA
ncbi:MAG: hypothetical protein HYZ14_05485 [Bacteroidetes bacterium]|nr:hypothetical protein [Bacteroidota bacterium]